MVNYRERSLDCTHDDQRILDKLLIVGPSTNTVSQPNLSINQILVASIPSNHRPWRLLCGTVGHSQDYRNTASIVFDGCSIV